MLIEKRIRLCGLLKAQSLYDVMSFLYFLVNCSQHTWYYLMVHYCVTAQRLKNTALHEHLSSSSSSTLLLLPLHLPLLLLLPLSRSDSFWSDAAVQFNCQKTFTDASADAFMNSRQRRDCCVHVGVVPRINWSRDTPQVLGVCSGINFYGGQSSFEDIKGLFF